MAARSFKMIAVLAFAMVLCSVSGMQAQAAEKDSVVVSDVKSYGNQVVVTVSNLTKAPVECKVTVTAMAGLVPVRATAVVKVGAGSTVQAPVAFQAFVSNVIVVGISDHSDPVS